jgi:hypothetical protein
MKKLILILLAVLPAFGQTNFSGRSLIFTGANNIISNAAALAGTNLFSGALNISTLNSGGPLFGSGTGAVVQSNLATALASGGFAGGLLVVSNGAVTFTNPPASGASFTNLPASGTTNYGVIVGGVALSGLTNFNSVSATNGYFTNIFATNLLNLTNLTYSFVTKSNAETPLGVYLTDSQANTNPLSGPVISLAGTNMFQFGVFVAPQTGARTLSFLVGSNTFDANGVPTKNYPSGSSMREFFNMGGPFRMGHPGLKTLAADNSLMASLNNASTGNTYAWALEASPAQHPLGITVGGILRGAILSNSIWMNAGFNSTNVVAVSNATTTYTIDVGKGQNYKFTNSVANSVYWITNWNDGNRFTVSIVNTGGASYWFSNASAGPLYPNTNSLAFTSDGAVHEFFSVGTNVYATKSTTNFSGRSF